jgi:hypothetical protein
MAVFANISIDQGSDFSSTITVEGADGLMVNLANYSARGQIRKTYTSLTAVNFQAAIQSEEGGTILISLTNEQTRIMKPGRYVYDVEIVHDVSESVTRVVEGQVEITPAVTQSSV